MFNLSYRQNTLMSVLAAYALWSCLILETSALDLRSYHESLEARYSRAHSLGDNYQFDPRDGWQTVNASDLQYKYDNTQEDEEARDYWDDLEERSDADDPDEDIEEDDESTYYNGTLASRADKKKSVNPEKKPSKQPKPAANSKVKAQSKPKSNPQSKTSASSVTSGLGSIMDSIKAVGKAEPVTITWYTGHDLENPSCWSNPTWAPTVGRQASICVESLLNSFGLGRFVCLRTYSGRLDYSSEMLQILGTLVTLF